MFGALLAALPLLCGTPAARADALAMKLWVAGGQRVGNHTYSHGDIGTKSPEEFLADVRRDEPPLELLDPAHDWHWLRYPNLHEGDTLAKRRAVRALLAARDYRVAQVTLEEAQRDPTYATDPDAASSNGGSLLEQWIEARKLAMPKVPPKPYRELEALCN